MNSDMKILIIEAYTDANVGSCALVENAIKLLNGLFPGADIRVMAHEPGVFHELYGVEAVRDIFEYPFLVPPPQRQAEGPPLAHTHSMAPAISAEGVKTRVFFCLEICTSQAFPANSVHKFVYGNFKPGVSCLYPYVFQSSGGIV